MVSAYCPDCDGRIPFNPHAFVGQTVTCPYCDTDLEVIGVDPVELDWAYDYSWDETEEEEEEDY